MCVCKLKKNERLKASRKRSTIQKKVKKHTQEEEEKEADEEEGRADWMEKNKKKAVLRGRAKRLAISILED